MERNGITYIGTTNYRSSNRKFGIKDRDRLQHLYVVGKSGTGKSTLIENMAISDMLRGNGLCVLDPHGDLAGTVLQHVPERRKADLVLFDATAEEPIGFNPLDGVPPKYHSLVASGLISTFNKIWNDSWGPRMEYILRFALLTLLCVPGSTLLDVQKLLVEKEKRKVALSYVADERILSFWNDEFDRYTPSMRSEAISPILNKVGLFDTSRPMKKILGQEKNGLKFGTILQSRKVLLISLSKGQIGEDACSLLGAMILNSVQLAAIHRASIPEKKRHPFFMYVDECHSFLTLSFSAILSEARKYALSLCLAHQYIDQLDERVRSAVFGNVGTMIAFRVGAGDAEHLAKEFFPVFDQDDFVRLPRYAMYLKLMIDGSTSQPFSAVSLEPRKPN